MKKLAVATAAMICVAGAHAVTGTRSGSFDTPNIAGGLTTVAIDIAYDLSTPPQFGILGLGNVSCADNVNYCGWSIFIGPRYNQAVDSYTFSFDLVSNVNLADIKLDSVPQAGVVEGITVLVTDVDTGETQSFDTLSWAWDHTWKHVRVEGSWTAAAGSILEVNSYLTAVIPEPGVSAGLLGVLGLLYATRRRVVTPVAAS